MTVHVFGPPADGTSLGPDERCCDMLDAGEGVVFHVESVALADGCYSCVDCAATSADPHRYHAGPGVVPDATSKEKA